MDTWCFWNTEHTSGVEVSWQKAQLNTENGQLHVRDERALFDMNPFISMLAAPTQTRYTLNRNCLVAHTAIHRTAKMSLLVGQVTRLLFLLLIATDLFNDNRWQAEPWNRLVVGAVSVNALLAQGALRAPLSGRGSNTQLGGGHPTELIAAQLTCYF